MKRILAFIMCLSIIVGSSAFVLADTTTMTASSELEEASLLLERLNVISETQDFNSTLTRADLSIFVAKLLNVDIYSISNKDYYVDIEKNFWAKTAIDNLTDMGIFTVSSERLFRPNDKVTFNELCKVVISIAGYDRLAAVKGGWPHGYLTVAKQLDLFDNMNLNGEITVEQMVLLFYRTLRLNPLNVTGIEDSDLIYTVDESETVMSMYYDMYEISGQLTAVHIVGINGKSDLEENQVEISGAIYDVAPGMTDLYPYIGLEVNCYYKKYDNSGKREVVLIIPDGNNDLIEFNEEDMVGIEDKGSVYSLTYYDENNKIKTEKIARGAAIVKNGGAVEENVLKSFDIEKGYFKLIDCDNDGKIDVVLIYEYYDMVVGQVINPQGIKVVSEGPHSITWGDIASEKKIYDKYDDAMAIDVLKTFDRFVSLKNSKGEFIELDDITAGDVLSVYRSHDNTAVEVYKSSDVVRGTIDEISQDEDTSLVINGTAYKVSSECLERANNEFAVKVGFSGAFKLNMFGVIAYIEADAASQKSFGYLVDHDYQNQGFADSLHLKVFGTNGNMYYFNFNEKTEIDGFLVKDYSVMYQRLKTVTANFSPQVIRYGLDSEGKINYIDTAYQDPDYETDASLRMTGLLSGTYMGGKLGTSSKNAVISSSQTIVLLVPDAETISKNNYEDNWFKSKKALDVLSSTISHSVTSYRYDEHADFEDVLVLENGTGETWGSVADREPYLIDKVSQAINAEGERVNQIHAYYLSASPTILTTKDLSVLAGYNLQRGDMVWLKQDINNKVIEVMDVLYTMDSGKTFEGPSYGRVGTTSSNSDRAQFRVLSGWVTEVSGDVVRVGYEKGDIDESFSFASSSFMIYVIDKNAQKGGMIYKGSVSDIVDYRKGGEDCSNIFIYSRNGTPIKAFVYK